MLWYPIGTFLWDLEHSRWPVICIQSSKKEDGPPTLLLSKAEFWGDYYCRNCELEEANIDIYQKLAVLGKLKPWFFKIHNDIVSYIMVDFAMEFVSQLNPH